MKNPRPTDTTIVCVLTPPGEGGISVIEVRGPGAVKIVDGFFRSPRELHIADAEPGQLLYGTLTRDGETLDEVVIACVAQGEGTVLEVNCHGGAIASSRVVDALVSAGAKIATANERIDLLRATGALDAIAAEAAAHIPRAPTSFAAAVLLDQLRGALNQAVENIAHQADNSLDWEKIRADIESLLATASFGQGLVEPRRVAVVGRPNVGKSTLSNALLRFERMIVHSIPGTTRDTVEDLFSIAGIPFFLVDTAGLRDTADAIEHEGIERSRAAAEAADIILLVINGSEPLSTEDRDLLRLCPTCPRIIVINKCDLPSRIEADSIAKESEDAIVSVSATTDQGIEELERRILDVVYPGRPEAGAAVVFTARQEGCLKKALDAVGAQNADGVREALACLMSSD